jgi:hypothetical protein
MEVFPFLQLRAAAELAESQSPAALGAWAQTWVLVSTSHHRARRAAQVVER